jgi:hypothetical protein
MNLGTVHTRLNHGRGAAPLSGIGGSPSKRQLVPLKIQGRLKPGRVSTKENKSSNKLPKTARVNLRHTVPGVLGGTALAAPFIFPAPVFAAAEQAIQEFQFSHLYRMVDDHTMCTGCMALGTTFSIFTLAFTGRFLLSLYVCCLILLYLLCFFLWFYFNSYLIISLIFLSHLQFPWSRKGCSSTTRPFTFPCFGHV